MVAGGALLSTTTTVLYMIFEYELFGIHAACEANQIYQVTFEQNLHSELSTAGAMHLSVSKSRSTVST